MASGSAAGSADWAATARRAAAPNTSTRALASRSTGRAGPSTGSEHPASFERLSATGAKPNFILRIFNPENRYIFIPLLSCLLYPLMPLLRRPFDYPCTTTLYSLCAPSGSSCTVHVLISRSAVSISWFVFSSIVERVGLACNTPCTLYYYIRPRTSNQCYI